MISRCGFLSLFLLLWSGCAWGSETLSELQVQGVATVEAPADHVQFSMGVQNSATTAEKAMASNGLTMNRLEDALLKAGLDPGEYSTGRFNLQPNWAGRPRDADEGWRPQIVGYTASNTFRISTGKLNLIGEILLAGTAAGGNQVGQLIFSLSEEQAFRNRAIRLAAERARADAEILSSASGVKLGRLLKVRLEPGQRLKADRMMAVPSARRTMSVEAVSAAIQPPTDLKIQALVEQIYAIE